MSNILDRPYVPHAPSPGLSFRQYNLGSILEMYRDGALGLPWVQRSYDWNNSKKNELFETIFEQNHKPRISIPGFSVYETTIDGKKFWFIYDGQQKFSTILSAFLTAIDDTQKLVIERTALPIPQGPRPLTLLPFIFTEDDPVGQFRLPEEVYGKLYSELSEELKDFLFNFKIDVTIYDDVAYSESRMNDLFSHLQGGKPLTSGQKIGAQEGFLNHPVVDLFRNHPVLGESIFTNGKRKGQLFVRKSGAKDNFSLISTILYLANNPLTDVKPRRGAKLPNCRSQDDVQPWIKAASGLASIPQNHTSLETYRNILEDIQYILSDEESPTLSEKEFALLFLLLRTIRDNPKVYTDRDTILDVIRKKIASKAYLEMKLDTPYLKNASKHNGVNYVVTLREMRKVLLNEVEPESVE